MNEPRLLWGFFPWKPQFIYVYRNNRISQRPNIATTRINVWCWEWLYLFHHLPQSPVLRHRIILPRLTDDGSAEIITLATIGWESNKIFLVKLLILSDVGFVPNRDFPTTVRSLLIYSTTVHRSGMENSSRRSSDSRDILIGWRC